MSRRNLFRRAVLGATSLFLGGILLSACDDPETRKDRLGGLVEDVIDQVTGNEKEASEVNDRASNGGTSETSDTAESTNTGGTAPPADSQPQSTGDQTDIPPALAAASPEDRAIAGRLSTEALAAIDAERRQFAIGSIVAKPREIASAERAISSAPPSAARRAPSPEQDGVPDGASGVQAPPPPPAAAVQAPQPLTRDAMKSQRRIAMSPEIRDIQLDAQSTMFEEMDKLGLSGSVSASDSGMMVIDLFAEPTQLADGETATLETIAEDLDQHCPEALDKAEMESDKALATSCMIDLLRASGDFEYVEKDFIFHHQFAARAHAQPTLTAALTPADTLWSLQWNFLNNGNEAGESAGGTGFVDVWGQRNLTGSADVTVAVVDTGLVLDHPDIAGSPNIAPGWDMVSDPAMGNDGDGRDNDPNDPGDLCNPNTPFAADSFHGTHVAGTIGAAASNNAKGVTGGAWNVTIVPVRALGKCGGRLSDIVTAIRWAGGTVPAMGADGEEVWNENPADIINLSIGLFATCPASLQDAIDSVVERGAVVVSAAGNARLPTEFYAPGGCNNVISVAASDGRGHLAPYSNFGPEVDLLAPGGDLLRDDDRDGRPDGVLSTKPSKDCYDPVTGDTIDRCDYAYEQGTSMAAPHVSAALALIATQYPEMTGDQLEAVLLGSLSPRQTDQCTASCEQYPGATPIPGEEGVCVRTCGAGLLNLENLPN